MVDGAGAMYVLYGASGGLRLAIFNADGSPRTTWNLGTGLVPTGTGAAKTVMDLAADRCTLVFLQNNVIRRFDVCTGAFLSDFATP